MPLNDALLTIGAQAMQDAVGQLSLHSAVPDGTGSNETSAGRQTPVWDTAANGDMLLTADANFTGGAANGACTYLGLWDTAGTTWYGYFALTGDQTFNAAGEYTLTGITVTGSSTG